MKNLYETFKGYFLKSSFIRGTILGATAVSFVSYAAITFTTFTSNTTISSAAMNSNLTAISNEFIRLEGTHTKISSNQTYNCNGVMGLDYPDDFEILDIDVVEKGLGFNTTTSTYTASENGNFAIYFNFPSSTQYYGNGIQILINGSPVGDPFFEISGSHTTRLNVGDTVQLMYACDQKYGTDRELIASESLLVIKPL